MLHVLVRIDRALVFDAAVPVARWYLQVLPGFASASLIWMLFWLLMNWGP